MLDRGDDEAFRERVRMSRARAAHPEIGWTTVNDTLAHHAHCVASESALERCAGFNGMLRVLNRNTGNTCTELGTATLHRIDACGSAPACREELTLAWRVLAHAASYFLDGARLLGAGVAGRLPSR